MLPTSSFTHMGNCSVRDSISPSQLHERCFAVAVSIKHGFHDLIRKLSASMTLSAYLNFIRKWSHVLAPLLNHVLHVLFVSPKPQMIRSAAKSVIAFMAHEKAIWNFSVSQSPCYAVCQLFSIPLEGTVHPAFSSSGLAGPNPTSVWSCCFIHLFPKALFDKSYWSGSTGTFSRTKRVSSIGVKRFLTSGAETLNVGSHRNTFRFNSGAARPAASTAWSQFILEASK